MTGSPERLPDFFIVGHPKSGTTALHEMLRRHPQVFMPALKEPRWFAPDLSGVPASVTIPGPKPKLPQTREEYLELFAPAAPGMVLGEASTNYLRSAVAAGLIAEECPQARIVAVFREPAGFLRSLQLELIQNHVETERDLALALANEDRGAGRLRYSDRVRYVEQLRRYREAFGTDQVLALIYDDFRADNEGTIRRVLRFLGVDDGVEIAGVEANPSVEVRFLGADRMLARLQGAQGPVARRAKGALKQHGLDRSLRRLHRGLLYGSPPSVEEHLTSELRRRFRAEVEAFGDYLGRDLVSLWGYDEPD
jgi:hypothetical protein